MPYRKRTALAAVVQPAVLFFQAGAPQSLTSARAHLITTFPSLPKFEKITAAAASLLLAIMGRGTWRGWLVNVVYMSTPVVLASTGFVALNPEP